MRLPVPLPLYNRRYPIAEVRVRRRPQGHPRNQPAPADAVQHRIFFSYSYRRMGRRQSGPHLHQGRILRRPRQHRPHDVRVGHESICVLMVLIHAYPIHPHLVCIDQLIQRPVVVLAHPLRVRQLRPRRVHPHRVVPVLEIIREFPVRHQVEHGYLHDCTSWWWESPSLPFPPYQERHSCILAQTSRFSIPRQQHRIDRASFCLEYFPKLPLWNYASIKR